MFMLTSTHKASMKACHKILDKWIELAENRKQQILLYEEQVANLKEQLYIKDILLGESKPLTESTISTKPSKFNSTEKAPYLNHYSNTGSDNVLP